MKEKKIKKVLIVRSDQIGDAVISLKLIHEIAKKFKSTTLLVSPKNAFIFKDEKKIRIIIEKDKPLYQFPSLASKIIKFINSSYIYLTDILIKKPKPHFDLLIDLCGDISILHKYPSRYVIGPNRLFFSIFYTTWYKDTFAVAGTYGKHLLEAYKEMLRDCTGLDIKLSDKPPANFNPKKKPQTFIFVGCVPKRNLPYDLWKQIILAASKYSNCIVADDPLQLLMDQLKRDTEIVNNSKIKLIKGKKSLDFLAKIANQSSFFIAVDGGGEHYLERYTNSLVIYTSGLPHQWKPYSLNPYKIKELPNEHILEYTRNSMGLYKFVFYKGRNRKPSYDLLDEFPYFKNLDVQLISAIIQSFWKTQHAKEF